MFANASTYHKKDNILASVVSLEAGNQDGSYKNSTGWYLPSPFPLVKKKKKKKGWIPGLKATGVAYLLRICCVTVNPPARRTTSRLPCLDEEFRGYIEQYFTFQRPPPSLKFSTSPVQTASTGQGPPVVISVSGETGTVTLHRSGLTINRTTPLIVILAIFSADSLLVSLIGI